VIKLKSQTDFDPENADLYAGEEVVGKVAGKFGQDKWKAAVVKETEGELCVRQKILKAYNWE
jgi:hypothetical protein